MKNEFRNGEKYYDPTAGEAIREADKPPEHVKMAIRRMKTVARWHGLEVEGRITLRDLLTGREWK